MPTLAPVKEKVPASMTGLVKESKQREAYINRIKQMVAKPVDNLDHPIPLFNQLENS